MNISVKSEILEETAAHVDRLQTMWARMFVSTTCDVFLLRLKDHVHIFLTDLINESTQKEQIILYEINTLKTEATDLNRILNKEVEIGEKPEDMPLVMWQLNLDNTIEQLRKELNERRAEIFQLILQQEQLCNELGEQPLPLLLNPLPKEEELAAFRKHLNEIRDKREQRLNEMYELRKQIKNDIQILELLPKNESENRLLNPINQSLMPETLASLQELREVYKSQVEELKIGINEMFVKIQKLWELLGEDATEPKRKSYVEECKSQYNQRTFDILRQELQRCHQLRSQNLQYFIKNLRVEIHNWWDLTLKSKQDRKRFYNYYNDCYNEDLLELHELELFDLKSFYQKNKTIFELFEQRESLWSRMEALEAKVNEPGRFNNRGGQLLKEERERKSIGTKLPKIEQQLTDLVHDYQQRENASFMVFGKNILDIIAEGWKTKKNRPLYAGKMLPPPTPTPVPTSTPTPTPTPTRTVVSMRNVCSSTFSLRNTPSKVKLVTTVSTANLNKRHRPLASGTSTSSVNLRNRQPVQRQLGAKTCTKSPLRRARVLENNKRRSGILGQRSMGKNRNAGKATVNDKNKYITDENCGSTGSSIPDQIFQTFEPSAQFSTMSRPPRPKDTHSKTPSKKILKELNDDEKRHPPNIPEPRGIHMWQRRKL